MLREDILVVWLEDNQPLVYDHLTLKMSGNAIMNGFDALIVGVVALIILDILARYGSGGTRARRRNGN
jgi:hypothetical protein